MIQMAGGARAYKAVAALAANGGALFAQKLQELSDSAGSVNQAFAQTEQTFRMQWSQFIVTTKQVGEEVGNLLLPALTLLVRVLRSIGTAVKTAAEAVPMLRAGGGGCGYWSSISGRDGGLHRLQHPDQGLHPGDAGAGVGDAPDAGRAGDDSGTAFDDGPELRQGEHGRKGPVGNAAGPSAGDPRLRGDHRCDLRVHCSGDEGDR